MEYWETIRIESPAPGVARIILARPEVRNAQSPKMLYELDRAFARQAADPTVKVIVLAADGPDFSSGHDLDADFSLPCGPVATLQAGLESDGIEGHYAFSINRSLDAQGFSTALDSAISLHNLGHANNLARYGRLTHPQGADRIRADKRR
jgi:enoyl-CoA hydratase/carnithine racemase